MLKSPIDYDPDTLANFFDKDIAKVGDSSTMPLIMRVCSIYQKGTTLNEIAKVTGTHRQQVKRMLQKGLKWFVDNYGVEEGNTEGKTVP